MKCRARAARYVGMMVRRLLGFAILPLVGIVTPFLLLPIIARVGGPAVWTGIGVGQSVGVVGSVLTLWGWWVAGPARLAVLTREEERARLYVESLQQRLVVFVLVAPVSGLVAWNIAVDGDQRVAALMAIASSAIGLSPSWYSIGIGKPLQMVLFDEVPRAISIVAAAGVILWTGAVWFYPLVVLLVGLAMPLVFAWRVSVSPMIYVQPFRALLRDLRRQMAVAGTNLIGTSYTATPVPAATLFSDLSAVASFVSAEKIYRLGTFSIKSLGNAVSSWVLEGGRKNVRRHWAAIAAHATLGLGGCLGLTFAAAPVTGFLFGPELAAGRLESFGFGLAFVFLSLSTPLTRNILVPNGRSRFTLLTGITAASVGVPAMLILGYSFGVAGIAFGLALSQCLGFSMLLAPALVWLRASDGGQK